MAKSKDVHDPAGVTRYIQKLDPAFAKVIESIRQLILDADRNIGEQIKWNSPSFFYTGEMKPFNPKEYKRDIIVMNLHKGRILLVFPTGAVVKDHTGFLEGDYADGRRVATFQDMKDVKARGKALQQVVKEWIKMIDR